MDPVAPTAGVQALSINSGPNTRPLPVDPNQSEATVTDTNGRKRRKISHLESVPLPTTSSAERPAVPATSWTQSWESAGGGGDWDHLLRWTQEGDDLVEDDDMVEIEEEEEEVNSEEEDHEDEPQTNVVQRRQTGKLSQEEIIEVINERIEYYMKQWRPGKGVEKIPDPEQLWEEAESAGVRKQYEQVHNENIKTFTESLDRISDEILKVPLNSVEQAHKVCKNLETTVDLLEEAEWLASIYALEPEDEDEDDSDDDKVEGQSLSFREATAGSHVHHPIVIDLGSPPESEIGDTEELLVDKEDPYPQLPANTDGPTFAHGRTATPKSPKAIAAGPIISSPSSQRSSGRTLLVQSAVHDGDSPELASIKTVSQWEWNDLIAKKDRKRIVMKVIYEMDSTDREILRTRINSVRKQDLLNEIPSCVSMFLHEETKMQGVLPRDLPKIVAFAKLFLSWWLADDYFRKSATEWRLVELAESLKMGCRDLDIFHNYVRHVLDHTFSENALREPEAPTQSEYIVISDDDD